MPNSLLLSHLAAHSDDETIVRAMSGATFVLTGEIGAAGFGATTLDGGLVLFTHPEFHAVAGLPPGLKAVEATAKQAAEYAATVGLKGFVLNPGTHQRFVAGDAVRRLQAPLRPPEPPVVPLLTPASDPGILDSVLAAAEASNVERVWLAKEGVVTYPHPDPAFEAGLLARDVRLPSYGANPEWPPVFERGAQDRATVRLGALPRPLDAALAKDLIAHARIHRLDELWAFVAIVGDADPTLAFAYAPHPHDGFARDFNVLHARHHLGADVPLLSAKELGETLPRIGQRLP